MENIIRDESGLLVDDPAQERQWGPLSLEEGVGFEQQKRAIYAGASLQPMDVMAEYEHGQICNAAKPTGYWQRVEAYRDLSFSEFAAKISGKCSRQTIDRRILVARVFRRETVQRCQQGKVGMSVLIGLCGFHWRLRAPLLDLALQGVPTRALWAIKQAGQKVLAARQAKKRGVDDTSSEEDLQAGEAAMKEAHARWQSGQLRLDAKNADPGLLPADPHEARLAEVRAQLERDIERRIMELDARKEPMEKERKELGEWFYRLHSREDELVGETLEALARCIARAKDQDEKCGILVKAFSGVVAPEEAGQVGVRH